jgi:hypothetical protein
MIRTFIHSFEPPSANPISRPAVDLDVSEIDDAGIREVLQTPGAAYGAWSILDTLLTSTGPGSPFTFKEPLTRYSKRNPCILGCLEDDL